MSILRNSDNIRINILKELRKNPINSYFQLTKIIRTGFITIKNNCESLKKYKFIKIEKIPKNKNPSKRDSFRISITNKGLKFLKLIEN